MTVLWAKFFLQRENIIKDGDNHFTVTVSVVVSGQFLAWVFGFGDEAEIVSPENVRVKMKSYTESVLKKYS